MTRLSITAGGYRMVGVLLEEKAPRTCAVFKEMLPLNKQVIHVRWSGQGVWIPYGDLRTGLEYENNTSHPAKGEMLFYPGGVSEMELILSYGRCLFSSTSGQLSGNHFLTIVEGLEHLDKLGEKVLWEGVQDICIDYLQE